MTKLDPNDRGPHDAPNDPDGTGDDRQIRGMGAGIAGPSEAGVVDAPVGDIAIGGETEATSRPSSGAGLGDAVAEALRSASGKPREAVDENSDRETGSPGSKP